MALNRQALTFIAVPPVVIAAALIVLRPARWDAMRLTGAVLTIVATALVTITRLQLGNSFSVTAQARALVTTGLYRKIRNPMYVFAAFLVAGFVLYVGMPKLLLILLVLIPVQVLRARTEGRTLENAFGEEYREWKRQTWF